MSRVLPKLCEGVDREGRERRKVVFKEWRGVCPGCARGVVDELGRERVGRRRGGFVGEFEGGRAGWWERAGDGERESEVRERRGWGRWGDGY